MRRFIFSGPLEGGDAAVVRALTPARVTCREVVLVETAIPEVAALLATLDTVEEIPEQEPASKAKPKQKKMAKRVYTSGQLVECKICHRQTLSSQICKSGECKTCRMNARRLQKLQGAEKSQLGLSQVEVSRSLGQQQPNDTPYNPLLDKPDYSKEESRQERLARPKVTLKLDSLSGRKVG